MPPRRSQIVSLDPIGLTGYLASRQGVIYTATEATPRPLTPTRNARTGRLSVQVRVGGKIRRVMVARVVLAAFGHPSPNGLAYAADPRNGDHSDCRLVNLRWVKRGQPNRETAIKLIRGLMAKYDVRPEDLATPRSL